MISQALQATQPAQAAQVIQGVSPTVIWAALAALCGVAALIGPALVILGFRMGTLNASTRSAHHRISEDRDRVDRLEERLTSKLDELKDALERAIRESWRFCPNTVRAREVQRDGG